MANVPLGHAARATRTVSSGMGPNARGYIDMVLLLTSALFGLFFCIVPFQYGFHSPTESYTGRFLGTMRFSRGGGCGGRGEGVLAPPWVGVQSPHPNRSHATPGRCKHPHPPHLHSRPYWSRASSSKTYPCKVSLCPCLRVGNSWQGREIRGVRIKTNEHYACDHEQQ